MDLVTLFYKKGSKDTLIFDPNLAQSQFILRELKRKALQYNRRICTENLEVAANLTALGLGYGVLPTRVATQYNKLEPLKGAPSFKDIICLVYRPEKHNNKVSQEIIQILKKSNI